MKQLKQFEKNVIYFILLAVGGWIASLVLSATISLILEGIGFELRQSENNIQIAKAMAYWYFTIPMVVLFAPLVEETVFRGAIFNFAEDLKLPFKLNLVLAFILSSSIFGLIHVVPAAIMNEDPTELVLGITYISTGLVLTIIYYLTRNIFVSILAHFIQNFLAVVIMILSSVFEDLLPAEATSTTEALLLILRFLHIY